MLSIQCCQNPKFKDFLRTLKDLNSACQAPKLSAQNKTFSVRVTATGLY